MYRQILIDEQDLDYQRILWRSNVDDPISEYQLLTVTYGTRSAPFLALRVLKQLIEDEGHAFPLACFVLENNIYIDDFMFGSDSLHSARIIRDEVIFLLRKAKFEPRKWASNCFSLISDIDPQDHGLAWTAQSPDGEGIKVLGLEWNPSTDEFQFKVQSISVEKITKRSILSIISKFYDPVGWISPVIIVGKILMQKLWRLNCSWDDELPKELNIIWSEFVLSLPDLSGVKVPRWIQLAPNNTDVQMHGFSDASELAYGAVLYLRITTSSGEVIVNLLASKTKVAPIKQLSLPRLELQAAVLLAQLIESVREAKSLFFHSIHCWTDSTIVLAWLKKHPSDWKTFVANRISEIQTLLPDCTWRHISSKNNPADISSRGVSPSELINSNLWWNGPKLLIQSENEWPISNSHSDLQTDLEAKIHIHLVNESNSKILINELALRYSSWTKLLRAIVILKRFVKWLKLRYIDHNSESIKFPIIASELESAQKFWYRYLQSVQFASEIDTLKKSLPIPNKSKLKSLTPFIDHEGLLRVGGRLEIAELSYETKHQIILEPHYIVKLIITEIHKKNFHCGLQFTLNTLRQSIWLIHPRPMIKSVIHHCIVCIRDRAKRATQLMANLPQHRVVRPERAFSDCGVDYAGPLQVRMAGGRGIRSQPCYICVFVCCAVKAVHLEIVTSLTTDAFISAFQRFCSIRGLPGRLYSDCGTNFKGASQELNSAFERAINSIEFQNLIANDRIQWNFNPPAAPHFGGLWEAAVKSMKIRLVKIFGNHTPTYEELITSIYQISAMLNSRPLTPVTDDINDLNVLTPGHFLIGESFSSIPAPSLVELNYNRLSRWQQMQQLAEIFWNRWSNDYLLNLQQRVKWQNLEDSVIKGQMVLLRKPNLLPTKWILGRIQKTRKNSDGLIRTVNVKTATSEYWRPITELVLLPFYTSENEKNIESNCEN